MKKFFLSIILGMQMVTVLAQDFSLTGKLSNGEAIIDSQLGIQLLHKDTKVVLKQVISDSLGRFVFKATPKGQYTVVVKSIVYKPLQIDVILDKHIDLGVIKVEPISNNLGEVVISFIKPQVEQKAGKTIINVASSINAAGTTVLEVLQKSPGVSVDGNGNIKLRGKQGVMVMIDGKLQPLSGDDLATFLKAIPSDQVDKIELMANPSAKYDASGNAGVIDIRTKKENRKGTYGSIVGNFNQGLYARTGGGFDVSHLNQKLSLSAGYNYLNRTDFQDIMLKREFFQAGMRSALIDYDNNFKVHAAIHVAQVGIDYKISPSSTLGLAGRLYTNDNSRMITSQSHSYNTAGNLSSTSATTGGGDFSRRNPSANINYRYKHSISGASLNADVDYASYLTDNLQDNKTSSFLPSGAPLKVPYLLYGDLYGKLQIFTAKADYVLPSKGFLNKIETGIKSSYVTSDNDVSFFDRSAGQNIKDVTLSNHFIYKENINSGYISINHSAKRVDIQLGLRAENTNTNTVQMIGNVNNKRGYTQLFPNATIDYKLSESQQIGLSFSKRIDRPSYRQLNPFRVYLNETTSQSGNPDLQPQITYALELSHTISEKYSFRYAFRRTLNNIIPFIYQDPSKPEMVILTDRNLAVKDYYGIDFSAPVKFGKWFQSYNNAILFYSKFNGAVSNSNLDNSIVTYKFNSNNTFILTPSFSAEFSANYTSREQDGSFDFLPVWAVGVGFQKQFLAKKASLKLNATDVFYKLKTKGIARYEGYNETFDVLDNTRQVSLSFSYRFGNSGLQTKRKSGSEDEKLRAN